MSPEHAMPKSLLPLASCTLWSRPGQLPSSPQIWSASPGEANGSLLHPSSRSSSPPASRSAVCCVAHASVQLLSTPDQYHPWPGATGGGGEGGGGEGGGEGGGGDEGGDEGEGAGRLQ